MKFDWVSLAKIGAKVGLAALKRKKKLTTAIEVVEQAAQRPAGRRELVQILQQTHSGWVHHGWARPGSAAERHALETTGLAVRRRRGAAIDYGRQV